MLTATFEAMPGMSRENEKTENDVWQSTRATATAHCRGWNNILPATTATFEYILMAPTSAAIPLCEQPVTFVNQNFPYEVKCRKCISEPCSDRQDACYKTVVTMCFESKDLRSRTNSILEAWKANNPGRRFFTFVLPLCSNISNVKYSIRSAEFVWGGSLSNAAVFIKFLILSSDFGDGSGGKGEKLRLVFQTYCYESSKLLQQNSSLIQIYRRRGAERKRKIEGRKAAVNAFQEQYQPAYDYTILLDTDFGYDVKDEERKSVGEQVDSVRSSLGRNKLLHVPALPDDMESVLVKRHCNTSLDDVSTSRENSVYELDASNTRICANHPDAFIIKWLHSHRFTDYAYIFRNYNGEDILRLSISDLTALMDDKSEALRLFQALRKKAIEPQITIYMALEESDVYNMIKLYDGTLDELKGHIERLTGVCSLKRICIYGPRDIRILVTDEVVRSWRDESIFRAVWTENECTLLVET